MPLSCALRTKALDPRAAFGRLFHVSTAMAAQMKLLVRPRLITRLIAAAMLAGCAGLSNDSLMPNPDKQGWQAIALPGKSQTKYTTTTKDGRAATAAVAEQSASMWRRTLVLAPTELAEVSFSWWVPSVTAHASVADADHEDAAARVLFAFDGDHQRLSGRTRMLFELAHALSGEKPPYATLMYVWDSSAPVGSVIINPRTDRVRKIVLDSGSNFLEQWRDHRRDLLADFRLAFGEEPGTLLSMALMTDTDNTRSVVRAWYGDIQLFPPGTPRTAVGPSAPATGPGPGPGRGRGP